MGIKLINESDLKNVADAIREKSGTDSSLSFPSGFVDAIENISTGGSSASSAKSVNFRDYDGTVVASYTADEFAELIALPSNPDHTSEGLTTQGWNWTLSDAKAYVAKYGRLEIGQVYITTDGKTHIHIRLKQGRTSPMLGVCPNGTVDVDWGDGTEHDTLTGTSTDTVKWTPNHSYVAPGDYVIKLTVTGSMGLYGNSAANEYSGLLRYSSSVDGRNISYQSSILNVNIGDDVTSIGVSAFQGCYSLSSINIPDNVTSINSNAFQYCYSLSSINIPDNVTSIGNNVFQNCYSLSSINIPDNVTSINNSTFRSCYSLSSITIPNGVTSISAYAFYSCAGIAEYHFKSITPPTLANTSAFTNIPTDCVIYVPYSADHSILEAYKTATNWSTYADRMQEEPQ